MGGIEQILIKAGLVSQTQLNCEHQAAEYFGISPGHMIAGSKHVSDQALLVCLKLNSLVGDTVISLTQAAQIARFIVKHHKTWNDAMLTVTGALPRQGRPKLGELLVEAGLITPIQVAAAMITAARKEIPLGEALVRTRLLRRSVLVRALALQDSIREHGLAPKVAAGQLRFGSLSTNSQQGIIIGKKVA